MDKDHLENLIFDELLKLNPKEKNIKRGFFAGDYLRNLWPGASGSVRLVTENDVRTFLDTGARIMTVPAGAIITPLARDLWDETNIKVEYERPEQ